MKNLRIDSLLFLKKTLILLSIIFFSNNIYSLENIILFKINDKAFTSLDLNKRLQYLDFVGNNENLDKITILNDIISANLFFEYYSKQKNKVNYDEKVKEIFKNIKNINNQNNKIYSYNINEENILFNLKLDFIRKSILESLLNSNLSNINKNAEEVDILYDFVIKYINFELKGDKKVLKTIQSLKDINIEAVSAILKDNDINYFTKKYKVNDINKIDRRIKQKILSNNNFLLLENSNKISIIFIQKNFETLDTLIANIYSIKSEEIINDNDLNCERLKKFEDKKNVVSKNYKFSDLNNNLKNNLININDFIKMTDDDGMHIYIMLCGINFDKNKLNNLNINKLVNSNVINLENQFVKKYSKVFNLLIINE